MSAFDEVQAMWEGLETETPASGGGDKKWTTIPDGLNNLVIKEIGTGQNDGRPPYVYVRFYSPAVNSEETSYYDIKPVEGALKAVRNLITRLGFSVPQSPDPSAIARTIKPAEGWTVEVKKVSTQSTKDPKKFYRSYYVNKVVEKTELPQDHKGDNLTDDSIPF